MLIGKSYKTQLMPKVPHVLKCLYDSDYVEEEVFLQWGSKVIQFLFFQIFSNKWQYVSHEQQSRKAMFFVYKPLPL